MSAFSEIGRLRRQQIVNLSITEMMLLLVFMAMTFSFLADEEHRAEVPLLHKQIQELRFENQKLQDKLEKSLRELQTAKQAIAALIKKLNQLEPNQPPIPNPLEKLLSYGEQIKTLKEKLLFNEAIINGLKKENDALIKASGKRGQGKPKCRVTTKFMILFELHQDGSLSGASDWHPAADSVASKLPGIEVLTSKKPLQYRQYRNAASKLQQWGLQRDIPCTFTVRTKRHTTQIEIYEKQLRLLERYFYVKRG
jgi:hypothetical protein